MDTCTLLISAILKQKKGVRLVGGSTEENAKMRQKNWRGKGKEMLKEMRGKKRNKQAQIVIQHDSGEESGNEWLPKEDNPYSDHTFDTFTESHCFSAAEMSSNDERNNITFNAYDWLGDTAMTFHVCNWQDMFVKFKAKNPKVKGVTNLLTVAKGWGTVYVEVPVDRCMSKCMLKDILYIPTNQTNPFSLRFWDIKGNCFEVKDDILSLKTKSSQVIMQGKKLNPNLYHMSLKVAKPDQINVIHKIIPSWTTWHLHFGHIGYSGLQKLVDQIMVDGLEVKHTSEKPECELVQKLNYMLIHFLDKLNIEWLEMDNVLTWTLGEKWL